MVTERDSRGRFLPGSGGHGPRPSVSFKSLAKRVKCQSCGESHVARARRPGWCLTCDIRDRIEAGEDPGAVAGRFELPRFLIEATATMLLPARVRT